MNYKDLLDGIERFGTAPEDICLHSLGISADRIRENVIISPGWPPEKLGGLGEARVLVEHGPLFGFTIWDVVNENVELTYMKAGFGAPMVMDAMLPLGVTKCQRILFVSSVGALTEDIHIGDIVVPELSVCGDGASRYISSVGLEKDSFGEKAYPDPSLLEELRSEVQKVCVGSQVNWHNGQTFCTDTILAQYPHIDSIIGMGCNTIDMESAAAFKLAKLMGIPMAALLNVSDNTVANKPVVSGRTEEELSYRKFVRDEIMSRIILNLMRSGCGQ